MSSQAGVRWTPAMPQREKRKQPVDPAWVGWSPWKAPGITAKWLGYSLVMTNIAIENGPVEIVDFSHRKWWFSIAMLVITRGYAAVYWLFIQPNTEGGPLLGGGPFKKDWDDLRKKTMDDKYEVYMTSSLQMMLAVDWGNIKPIDTRGCWFLIQLL